MLCGLYGTGLALGALIILNVVTWDGGLLVFRLNVQRGGPLREKERGEWLERVDLYGG